MADRGSTTGTPRWVWVFVVIGVIVVLLIVIALVTGKGGDHGPGRHTGGNSPTPTSTVTVAAAIGGPALADQAARTIVVTTFDTMAFEPSNINVSAGETVTFSVTNTGQIVHEFTLGMPRCNRNTL